MIDRHSVAAFFLFHSRDLDGEKQQTRVFTRLKEAIRQKMHVMSCPAGNAYNFYCALQCVADNANKSRVQITTEATSPQVLYMSSCRREI